MRKALSFVFIFFTVLHSMAQGSETPNGEQQLENITANNEDLETEDDSYLQQMVVYINNPVNLNETDAETLNQMRVLTPIQIQNFISYRSLVGKLIDIYELQAVPGWDVATLQKIRPYICVSSSVSVTGNLRSRLRNGDHSILFRASQLLERSKGYLPDSAGATNLYLGSPQKYLFRYRYAYKNLLQYGIVGEKDAGEQFFKGKQRQGFDFYSAHVFVRNLGIIRSFAMGDFTVNLGQGLIQWQSLAFKKSADVIHIKREAAVLRPYNSAGEINFHRGIGITLEKNNWQLTVFGSYKKIDANLVTDSSQLQDDFISSLQTSGYHRTKNEVADKGVQRQLAFGGNLSYKLKHLRFGINAVQYQFKLPLIKSGEAYNKYALTGDRFGNFSFDYSYTFRNAHIFGEAAFTSKFDKAFVNGLMVSASAKVDISLLYRNISKSYQSLYTSAFTESAYPTNETGIYLGVSLRPADHWRIDAYADLYKFPWLRYRVDASSTGADYLLQINFKPNKKLELYTRYHAESKAINLNLSQLALSPVIQQPRKNWRTQVSYKANEAITIRNRIELVWFDKKGPAAEQGFLSFFDLVYKPMLNPLSGSLRLQYFETNGYNSRIYAYENDVLYNFSIPVFYDKGFRYYLNLNYDIKKDLAVWIRWSQTIYRDKHLIGSGIDEIKDNAKTEVKVQAIYKF